MSEEFYMAAQSDRIEVRFIIQKPFKVSLDGGVVSITGRMRFPAELLYVLLVDECGTSGIEYVGKITGSGRPEPDVCRRIRDIIASMAAKTSPTDLMAAFASFVGYGPVEIGVQCCSGCGLYAPRSSDLAAHWLNSHPYEAMRMGLWARVCAHLDALAQVVRAKSQLPATASGIA